MTILQEINQGSAACLNTESKRITVDQLNDYHVVCLLIGLDLTGKPFLMGKPTLLESFKSYQEADNFAELKRAESDFVTSNSIHAHMVVRSVQAIALGLMQPGPDRMTDEGVKKFAAKMANYFQLG